MNFKIGAKVTVIDEDLSGFVTNEESGWVEFDCEDGFTYRYPKSSLYAVDEENHIEYYPGDLSFTPKEEDISMRPKGIAPINFNKTKTEFDLHIESLFPDRIPSQKEVALEIQLNYAKAVIQKAIQLRAKQLVFIHGMGQGVLREELRKMLIHDFPNIEFFDANYQRYGQGATEVIIHGLGSI